MLTMKNVASKIGSFDICDINLSVKKGEYFVILGPTGAGKTLLLEMIAGLLKIDDGSIFMSDKEVTQVPAYERNVRMVYQDYMLFPHYTVKENIAYGLKIQKENVITRDKKTRDIAELFNITNLLNRYPKYLSGGEKQRVALARALVCKPDILLLDEPFAALDVITKEKFIREVKEMHKTYGTTCVHVAHDFEEAITLADRIGVMNNGKLLQVGKPDDVFKKPSSEFVAHFVGGKNIFHGFIQENAGSMVCSVDGVDISVASSCQGSHYVTIRPEDIILSEDKITSSARNVFFGTVVDVLVKQYVCEVTVDIGVPIVSLVTKKSYEALNLGIGKKIWLLFKATEVHVF